MKNRSQYSAIFTRLKNPLANLLFLLFIFLSGVSESYEVTDLALSRSIIDAPHSLALVTKYYSNKLTIDQIYEINNALPKQRMLATLMSDKVWFVNNQPTQYIPVRNLWSLGLPDRWMIDNYALAYSPKSQEYKNWAEASALRYSKERTKPFPYKYARDYHAILKVIASKNTMVKAWSYNTNETILRRPRVVFNLAGIDPVALNFVADNFDVLTKDLYESATVYGSLISKKGIVTEWEFLTVMVNASIAAQTDLLQLLISPKTSFDIFGVVSAKEFGFKLPPTVQHPGFPHVKTYNYLLLPPNKSFNRYAHAYGIHNIGNLVEKVATSELGKTMFIDMISYRNIPVTLKQRIPSPAQANINPATLNRGDHMLERMLRIKESQMNKTPSKL